MDVKGSNDKQSTLIAFSIVTFMIFSVLYVDIKGNPLKFYEFKRGAEKYISKKYPKYDFYVESIDFDSREGDYSINIKSKESRDRWFSIVINEESSFNPEKENRSSFEQFEDNYEKNVLSGLSTFQRISNEYSEFVKSEIKDEFSIPLKSISGRLGGKFVNYDGEEYYPEEIDAGDIVIGDLKLDEEYDLRELGKLGGHIIPVFDAEETSEELVAKMLLEVKEYCDKNSIYFSAISMKVFGRYDSYTEVQYFYYEDIYKDGLVGRVKKNIEELHWKDTIWWWNIESVREDKTFLNRFIEVKMELYDILSREVRY